MAAAMEHATVNDPVRIVAQPFKKAGNESGVMQVTPDMPLLLDDSFVDQVAAATNAWRANVALEQETFVAREYGIPSFLVRMDCTVGDDGQLHVYEIEEPPAGAGSIRQIFGQYDELLHAAESSWPTFRAFISPGKKFSDVSTWLGDADTAYLNGDGLLWCVIRPEEADAFAHLIPRSVTPVRLEGDKRPIAATFPESNIVGTGSELLEQLDIKNRRWVFKPIQGTRAHKVVIWWVANGDGGRPKEAIANFSKLGERLLEDPTRIWLAQPWATPRMVTSDFTGVPDELSRFWYIRRIYAAYSPKHDCYVPIGGVANMLDRRKFAIVHGRSAAVFAHARLSARMEQHARDMLTRT